MFSMERVMDNFSAWFVISALFILEINIRIIFSANVYKLIFVAMFVCSGNIIITC